MEIQLAVNHKTCIKCRRCIKVCPAAIFYQDKPNEVIQLRNVPFCIVCGHCVAVCPTDSVIHGDFPAGKVHGINRSVIPSPESLMLLVKARRSNRAFSKKPVEPKSHQLILEAAHRAPTASNRQQVSYTLITNAETLKQVIDYTMQGFKKILDTINNPLIKPMAKLFAPKNYLQTRRLERILKEYQKGNDPILRNATSLILFHTPSDNPFGRDDANLAYQNASLMAESLGVAHFYTGYICIALRRDKNRTLEKMLGIKGTIHLGMALGIPEFFYPNYVDRKEIHVEEK